MFFIMGSGRKSQDCGTLDNFTCPSCRRNSSLQIIKTYNYFSIFFIPIIKMNVTYISTCTSCGNTTELSPQDGKEFERTGQFSPTAESFATMSGPIQLNAPSFCGQCGHRLGVSDRFCPHCGQVIAANQNPQT